MTELAMIFLVASSVVLLLTSVALAVALWRALREVTDLVNENIKVRAEATRLGEIAQQVEHWREQAVEQERRRVEVVETIVNVQKERDKWRDLYMTCGAEHGNAQELLFAELGRVYKVCRANKINIKESPVVRRVVEEFAQKHTGPIKQDMGGNGGSLVGNHLVEPVTSGSVAGTPTLEAPGVTKTLDLPATTLAGSNRG